jgi:hypothetical protein
MIIKLHRTGHFNLSQHSGNDIFPQPVNPIMPRVLITRPSYSMSDRAIRHVYVHGKPVVSDGKLCGLEEPELRRRVVTATRRLFAMPS